MAVATKLLNFCDLIKFLHRSMGVLNVYRRGGARQTLALSTALTLKF